MILLRVSTHLWHLEYPFKVCNFRTISALLPACYLRISPTISHRGKKTGALETLLHAVAEHYEGEANHTIKNLPTIIEPILLVVVATFVLFLALAVFLPLWDMVGLIRK